MNLVYVPQKVSDVNQFDFQTFWNLILRLPDFQISSSKSKYHILIISRVASAGSELYISLEKLFKPQESCHTWRIWILTVAQKKAARWKIVSKFQFSNFLKLLFNYDESIRIFGATKFRKTSFSVISNRKLTGNGKFL